MTDIKNKNVYTNQTIDPSLVKGCSLAPKSVSLCDLKNAEATAAAAANGISEVVTIGPTVVSLNLPEGATIVDNKSETSQTKKTSASGIKSNTGPKRSSVNKIKIDEFLIGLALANVLAFSIQDFFVLLMYKTVGLKGQSLLSATVLALIALIALYVYLYLVPEGFSIL